jgi:hypothetical protein
VQRLLLCPESGNANHAEGVAEGDLDSTTVALLPSLPHLDTLGASRSSAAGPYPALFFDALLRMPSLTALEVTDHGTMIQTELQALAWLPILRRLHLRTGLALVPLKQYLEKEEGAASSFAQLKHFALDYVGPLVPTLLLVLRPLQDSLQRLHLRIQWLPSSPGQIVLLQNMHQLEHLCLECGHSRLIEGTHPSDLDPQLRRDVSVLSRVRGLRNSVDTLLNALSSSSSSLRMVTIVLAELALDYHDESGMAEFPRACADLREAFSAPRIELRATLPPEFVL